MSDTQSPVPKDHPLMLAWEAYKADDEYANTRKWALYEKHVDGSLWAAFSAGFSAQSSRELDSETKDKLLKLAKWFESIESGQFREQYRETASMLRRVAESFTPDTSSRERALVEAARKLMDASVWEQAAAIANVQAALESYRGMYE